MKKVLFVCVENSCRSQIAEGFARELGKEIIEPFSAGSRPSGIVNPDAIAVMREEGIDISKQRSKGFNNLPAGDFDYMITMGCKDTCPFYPAVKFREWQIPDPKGKNMEFFRSIRETIKKEIENLIAEIKKNTP
jgi:protein-tyrosine-phosphatase